MDKHATIILVNWNGWQDTLECLESTLKQDYRRFDVVIVDNHSSDDSIEKIRDWAASNKIRIDTKFPELVLPLSPRPVPFYEIEINAIDQFEKPADVKSPAVYAIKNNENSGFAIANNIGMQFAMSVLDTDYFFLLNNDTVIKKDTLRVLVETSREHPELSAIQAAIYYYDLPETIWHVGGKILPWLQTSKFRDLGGKPLKQTDFVVGAALFLPAETVRSIGALSDRFFHGEEDFEFSMRLRRNKRKAAVAAAAVVFHKVAVSSTKELIKKDGTRIINAALNRLVHMKLYLRGYRWQIWRFFTMLYFYALMVGKHKLSPGYSVKLYFAIYRASTKLDRVTRQDINQIMHQVNV